MGDPLGRGSVSSALVGLVIALCACATSLPSGIRAELARSPRGTATVVFFTDFQCPYCRRTHAALEAAMAKRAGRVRVVIEHVPLRGHPDARTAARAAVCAELQGIDLTHALFDASSLSDASCAAVATNAGVDRVRFQECVSSASAEARIARDTELFDAAAGDGVPLLYVGSARLDGEQSEASLLAAIDRALAEAP